MTFVAPPRIAPRSTALADEPDERLAALARSGSEDAFEVLVNRYRVRMLVYCRRLLGSADDAEDVVQEVFTAVFRALEGGSEAICFRSWLYRTAHNRCVTELRRRPSFSLQGLHRPGADTDEGHVVDPGATPPDRAAQREDVRMLLKDLRTLPMTQRSALVLREFDALSYERVAEEMRTSVPSVKSLLVRARLSLADAAAARELSCEDVRLQLADGARLVGRGRSAIRAHIRGCASCAAYRSDLARPRRLSAAVVPVMLLRVAALREASVAALGAVPDGGATAGLGASLAAKAAAALAVLAVTVSGGEHLAHAPTSHPRERPTRPSAAGHSRVAMPAGPTGFAPPATATRPDAPQRGHRQGPQNRAAGPGGGAKVATGPADGSAPSLVRRERPSPPGDGARRGRPAPSPSPQRSSTRDRPDPPAAAPPAGGPSSSTPTPGPEAGGVLAEQQRPGP